MRSPNWSRRKRNSGARTRIAASKIRRRVKEDAERWKVDGGSWIFDLRLLISDFSGVADWLGPAARYATEGMSRATSVRSPPMEERRRINAALKSSAAPFTPWESR